jgi:hypothetical protein
MARLHSTKVYPHGDNRRYVINRCRCDECGAAHNTAARDRRRAIVYGTHRGHVDATGTIRRLRALAAIGHSARQVAHELSVDPSWIRALYRGEHTHVHADTAERFSALYERLQGTPGPSQAARRMARRRGWSPPLAWDDIDNPAAEPVVADDTPIVDWVAVELALKGSRVRLIPLERLHAVHAGHNRGMSYSTIADALHMSLSRTKELGGMPLPEGCEVAA